jgi:DNA-binding protein YbaB
MKTEGEVTAELAKWRRSMDRHMRDDKKNFAELNGTLRRIEENQHKMQKGLRKFKIWYPAGGGLVGSTLVLIVTKVIG